MRCVCVWAPLIALLLLGWIRWYWYGYIHKQTFLQQVMMFEGDVENLENQVHYIYYSRSFPLALFCKRYHYWTWSSFSSSCVMSMCLVRSTYYNTYILIMCIPLLYFLLDNKSCTAPGGTTANIIKKREEWGDLRESTCRAINNYLALPLQHHRPNIFKNLWFHKLDTTAKKEKTVMYNV